MKTLKFSLIALCAIGNLAHAGGDIAPVTYYETEDEVVSEQAYEEAYVDEPVYEPVVEVVDAPVPEPQIEIEPEPVPIPEPIVEEEEEIYVAPTPTVTAPPPPPPPPVREVPKMPVVTTHVPVAPAKKVVPNGFYAGLGITGVRYDSGCDCKTVDTKDTSYGGVVRVGYDFNRYVGVEARGAKTAGDSEVDHVGVYVKPMIPITQQSNIYGLIGAAHTKVKGDLPHADADSLALGAGIEVDLSKDIPRDGRYARSFDGQGDQEKGLGLFVDYERMIVKDDAPDVDAVSAGVTYDF